MGLDTVELVMQVEETFDITIPDAEAEKIQTIGDLHRYVLARLEGSPEGVSRCLTAATFYSLRRQLMGCLRIERARIRPDSALADLIPEADRREDWEQLGRRLHWEWPTLLLPRWVGLAFLGLMAAWAASLGVSLRTAAGLGRFVEEITVALVVLHLAGAVATGVLLSRQTRRLAIGFPANDIRGLIPILLASNVARIRGQGLRGWSPPEVWDVLIANIAHLADVPPDQLKESTSFVKDLF